MRRSSYPMSLLLGYWKRTGRLLARRERYADIGILLPHEGRRSQMRFLYLEDSQIRVLFWI